MLMFLFLAQELGDLAMTILPNPGLSAKSGKKYLLLFRQMQHVPWHQTRIWRIRMYPYSTGSSSFVSDSRRRRVLVWRYGKPHTDLIHIILMLPYLEDKQHTLPKQTSTSLRMWHVMSLTAPKGSNSAGLSCCPTHIWLEVFGHSMVYVMWVCTFW